MGDPERYRTKDEVGEWRDNDPIGIFRKYLLDRELVDEEALNESEANVEAEVAEAVKFAESSPDPSWEDLVSTVYVEENRDYVWPK